MSRNWCAKVSHSVFLRSQGFLFFTGLGIHGYVLACSIKAEDETVEKLLHVCVDDLGFDLTSIAKFLLLSPLPSMKTKGESNVSQS